MRIARALVDGHPELLVETEAEQFVRLADLVGLPPSAPVSDLEALLATPGLLAQTEELLTDFRGNTPPVRTLAELTLLAPVRCPQAIVCVGRNYLEHIREGDSPIPPYPILFSKFSNTLTGSGASVAYPSITTMLDYEGEVAAVIGRTASKVRAADALDYVAGYTIMNDISARDLQEQDLQWIRGKSLDGFAPLGPVFVTRDSVADYTSLRIETRVNGEVRQDDTLASMIWGLPDLIEFITAGITLRPGDVIATGTPSGTGVGFKPPKYLRPGDKIEVAVSGIGVLTTTIAG
jgi:2-keto-4-pentenoate hydratase/2-oxohepta-3-ene-1,7-dioic acid hydratase in catechol pathway